jgi:hypothetical protein
LLELRNRSAEGIALHVLLSDITMLASR